MIIHEITEEQLLNKVTTMEGAEALLFYTPLCGTCKLAERMLEIVQQTSVSIPSSKLNINYAPRLRDQWKITSVPCLVLLKDGEPIRFEYAIHSVDHVYGMLQGLK